VSRRVTFVVFEGLQILDLTGPLEVFSAVNRRAPQRVPRARPPYVTEVVSSDGRPVRASCGLEIAADRAAGAGREPIDTLVVVGGPGTVDALGDPHLIEWIGRAARRSRRVTSVCTGAFLLAEAGLLDGRRATTHWSQCGRLAARYPSVTVETDPIFVRDENVWTSAGVTAGIDLALRLVEEDHDPAVARDIARWLVMFVQRPGGQAQFSTQLAAQKPQRSALGELESWIPDHLGEDLSVSALAQRTGMSTRNFARAFRGEVGITPAAYVEAVRVEAARRLLETTARGLPDVAGACGFGTVETMHRSFRRTVQITPGQYRHHFTHSATA
jgi:transcriptional regulator GlxA family with amidase domain